MRRTIIIAVVVLLALVTLAPAASAIPEPKGCPAEPSSWYFTDYVTAGLPTDPGYVDSVDETGMWAVLFDLTIVGQAYMDAYGLSQAETYYAWTHGFIDRVVDRNADDAICVQLDNSGANGPPGVPVDYGMHVIDNNANAA
jgi:hypothetical protein